MSSLARHARNFSQSRLQGLHLLPVKGGQGVKGVVQDVVRDVHEAGVDLFPASHGREHLLGAAGRVVDEGDAARVELANPVRNLE